MALDGISNFFGRMHLGFPKPQQMVQSKSCDKNFFPIFSETLSKETALETSKCRPLGERRLSVKEGMLPEDAAFIVKDEEQEFLFIERKDVIWKEDDKKEPKLQNVAKEECSGKGSLNFFQKMCVATMQSLARDCCSFNYKKMREDHAKSLKEITGTESFYHHFQATVPAITQGIHQAILDECPDNPILNEFLTDETSEKGLLYELVEVLGPQFLINIEKHRQMSNRSQNLPADEARETLAEVDIILHLMSSLSGHFKDIHEKIQALDPKISQDLRRRQLREIFSPIVKAFLAIVMPNGKEDLPLTFPLRAILWPLMEDSLLPDAFADLYSFMIAPKMGADKDEFLDPAYKEFHGELYGQFSRLLPQAFEKFMPISLILASPKIAKDAALGITKANKQSDEPSDGQMQQWIQTIVAQLAGSKHPAMKKLWSLGKGSSELVLSHIFFNLLKNGAAAGVSIPMLFLEIKEEFVQAYDDKISARLSEIKGSPHPVSEDPKLLEMFTPLAIQILEKIGFTANKLGTDSELYSKILPKILASGLIELYNAQTSINLANQKKRKKLKDHYKSDNVAEVCARAADWAVDFIPKKLLNAGLNGKADIVYDSLVALLSFSSLSAAKEMAQYFQDHEDDLKTLLNNQFIWLGDGKDPHLQQLKPIMKGCLESFLLDTAVASSVQKKEKLEDKPLDPDFVAHSIVDVFDIVTKHFQEINRVRGQHGSVVAHRIDHQTMLNEFLLPHPAVINSTQALEIKNIASKFLDVMQLPKAVADSEEIREILKDEAIPKFLSMAFKMAADPNLLKRLLLVGINAQDAAFKKKEDVEPVPQDALQLELKRASGEVLSAIAATFSDKLIDFVFTNESIKDLIAEEMAAAIRQGLNAKTDGVQDIGEIGADKIVELLGILDLSQEEVDKELEEKLPSLPLVLAKKEIRRVWEEFQVRFDQWISDTFGPKGMEIKSFFDSIFNAIFIKGLLNIVCFILYPVYKGVSEIVRYYLNIEIDDAKKIAQMPVHENLFYHILDYFLTRVELEH